jgi:hypothetical protein
MFRLQSHLFKLRPDNRPRLLTHPPSRTFGLELNARLGGILNRRNNSVTKSPSARPVVASFAQPFLCVSGMI